MPEVGIVTLKSAPLQITTELPGRTSAHCITEVRPPVSGIILKRNFTEGSDIRAGVFLCQIDPLNLPQLKAQKAIWQSAGRNPIYPCN